MISNLEADVVRGTDTGIINPATRDSAESKMRSPGSEIRDPIPPWTDLQAGKLAEVRPYLEGITICAGGVPH